MPLSRQGSLNSGTPCSFSTRLLRAIRTRLLLLIIFHSDRCSQYGSSAFRQRLRAAGLEQSMSARANPYHNAWTESFIGTLKAEMLRDGCFASQQDAAHELFAFIDAYYNTRRLHSSLSYKSSSIFESEIALAN